MRNDPQRAPDEARQGETLMAQGQFQAARPHLAEAVRLQPGMAQYHWLMGICEWNLGVSQNAGWHLERAVNLDPNQARLQASLGSFLLLQGKAKPALAASAKSIELDPNNNLFAESHAWVLEANGELAACWDLVQSLMDRSYMSASLGKLYARLARRYGKQETALTLVNQLLANGGHSRLDESNLHFSAADLLEGMGRYDEAFAAAQRGNALREPQYSSSAHARWFERTVNYFTPEQAKALPRSSRRDERPVFIVGMPRSGTSLVEQILASHVAVFGAGELDLMYRTVVQMLRELSAGEDDFPQCLGRLSSDMAKRIGAHYLDGLAAMNVDSARIIDKMPLNFLHLGVISLILPGARVIHCRRDPMDTCLSCHMMAFNTGNDFKYNLTHLGLFYRQYERLMEHWKTVLDLPILDVRYEDLVSDTAGQSRRMVEFLDLPWDEHCLRFYETKRPVVTNSVIQVRRPIYRSSIGRWRHYEQHLAPLKAALEIT